MEGISRGEIMQNFMSLDFVLNIMKSQGGHRIMQMTWYDQCLCGCCRDNGLKDQQLKQGNQLEGYCSGSI